MQSASMLGGGEFPPLLAYAVVPGSSLPATAPDAKRLLLLLLSGASLLLLVMAQSLLLQLALATYIRSASEMKGPQVTALVM